MSALQLYRTDFPAVSHASRQAPDVPSGHREHPPASSSVKGRVTGIDLASGQIKMLWYQPRGDREIAGTLAPNAEILINGRTVRLEDVQIGDLVEVIGRVENKNNIVATQVHIKRAVATEPEGHSKR